MSVFTSYISDMKIGYGYRRKEADLEAAGAEKVFIDVTSERQERADMVAHGGVREGDTLLLFSMRDLGGSPKADAMWRARIEALGVKIEVVEVKGAERIGKPGRPRKFNPTPEQDEQCRKLWLCWHYTEKYKLRRIAEIVGHSVGRGLLFNRYGSMENPKQREGM